jgi:hypothetical protein
VGGNFRLWMWGVVKPLECYYGEGPGLCQGLWTYARVRGHILAKTSEDRYRGDQDAEGSFLGTEPLRYRG